VYSIDSRLGENCWEEKLIEKEVREWIISPETLEEALGRSQSRHQKPLIRISGLWSRKRARRPDAEVEMRESTRIL
jgi:hypothetical protein